MNASQLAARIESLQPHAPARDVARLSLMLFNTVDSLESLADDDTLTQHWRDLSIRLQAATDQHAAMTDELEKLASSDPRQFTPDQIWVLIRAIKVQSQVLELYAGLPVLDI